MAAGTALQIEWFVKTKRAMVPGAASAFSSGFVLNLRNTTGNLYKHGRPALYKHVRRAVPGFVSRDLRNSRSSLYIRIHHHHALLFGPNDSLERFVRFALGVVISHVVQVLKRGFGENGEALATGIVVQLVSVAGEDIRFPILRDYGD
jgi:hypothetical protein